MYNKGVVTINQLFISVSFLYEGELFSMNETQHAFGFISRLLIHGTMRLFTITLMKFVKKPMAVIINRIE